MDGHADPRDLTNRDSPSTTAAILRRRGGMLDYAALGDLAVMIERSNGEADPGHDDQTSFLLAYTVEGVNAARNTETNFWIASNRPDAAAYAFTGSVPEDDRRHHATRRTLPPHLDRSA